MLHKPLPALFVYIVFSELLLLLVFLHVFYGTYYRSSIQRFLFCSSLSAADYIHVCKAGEADIAKCIISSVEELRLRLKDGIPELDVPPLEPLPVDQIQLNRGPTNARIDANVTDLLVWGPSDFEIKDLKYVLVRKKSGFCNICELVGFRVDLAKNKFWFKVLLPRLRIEGKYDLDMNILFVQLKGHGPITGNFCEY